MTQNFLDLQSCFFMVDERELCLWDQNIQLRTLKFLNDIDPSYFDYLLKVHSDTIKQTEEETDKDAQHAALALRTAYSQALETLFALLFSAILAPCCIPAWINAYKNTELCSLVRKVQNGQKIFSVLETETPSWSTIFHSLFPSLSMEDKEYEAVIKSHFPKIWSYFAFDFLDEEFAREYNSIKHGLRIGSGGFRFTVGVPDEPGVAPPEEKMFEVTSSKFGSSYLVSQKISDQPHHIRFAKNLRNWDLNSLAWSLELAAISIANVQSALRRINGGGREIRFKAPDVSRLNEWKGFTNMSMPELLISPEWISPYTKQEIRLGYEAKKYWGSMKVEFINEEAAE